MKFRVAKLIWHEETIEAYSAKDACKIFEDRYGRPNVVHDDKGDDREIIGRCEACGLVIFEDEEIRLDVSDIEFCAPCFESMRDEEDP